MDAKQAKLEKELKESLKNTSELAAELQAIMQGSGVPHYDEIEGASHDVGQRLSRMTQIRRTREITAESPPKVTCPDCKQPCPVKTVNREVHSMDGRVELTENVAECRRCRRSFFPSA